MKKNSIIFTLVIVNIIIIICSVGLYNENHNLKRERIQLLQNISGKSTDWEMKDAFEISHGNSYYINLGYLEYTGTDGKQLTEMQADLLKDASDGEVVFSTIDKFDYNLISGCKIPLGSFTGTLPKSENLENKKLYLKLTYNAEGENHEEIFAIKGNYFEPFN